MRDIHIDTVGGCDETGDGSREKPFKSLEGMDRHAKQPIPGECSRLIFARGSVINLDDRAAARREGE